ncbi:MAG: 16S rRNA (guanine(966)-N(2))-methyltransferase RsmD [Gammaproteobacteria bacterium]|nr:16S rRNA (guanine(966)-N(2))-methyltransferase RsmD [Gammaproteobacteria bacterium]
MRSNKPQNQLRIIAGRWRGRKLAFAPVPGLRPTPDRVRETLFNWLGPVIAGTRCLDLYAGSGALGLEAASRGAAEVLLVDSNTSVTGILRQQLQRLDAGQVRVLQADATAYLRGQAQPYDIVFLDPPFREGHLDGIIRQLEDGGWLSADAWVYIEAERQQLPDLPPNWTVHRHRTAGQVAYYLVRRTLRPEPAAG